MIRITTDMDRYILDYKIQRSIDKKATEISPIEPTSPKKEISREQPAYTYTPSNNQNNSKQDNTFQQILEETANKYKKR